MLNQGYFLKIYFKIFVPSLTHSIQSSSVVSFLHMSEKFCFMYIVIKLKTQRDTFVGWYTCFWNTKEDHLEKGYIRWIWFLLNTYKTVLLKLQFECKWPWDLFSRYLKSHELGISTQIMGVLLVFRPQFECSCSVYIYKYPKSATRTLTERYPSFSY